MNTHAFLFSYLKAVRKVAERKVWKLYLATTGSLDLQASISMGRAYHAEQLQLSNDGVATSPSPRPLLSSRLREPGPQTLE
jgi:hypothetical protein